MSSPSVACYTECNSELVKANENVWSGEGDILGTTQRVCQYIPLVGLSIFIVVADVGTTLLQRTLCFQCSSPLAIFQDRLFLSSCAEPLFIFFPVVGFYKTRIRSESLGDLNERLYYQSFASHGKLFHARL